MLFVFTISTFSKRGTKGFATLGLTVKTLPLIIIIVAAVVLIPMGMSHPITPEPIPGVGNPEYDNSALNILTVIPAILFTYNGFLTSASMMNESKDYKTYKIAFIAAMVFAAVIYILYTVSIFSIGALTLESAIIIVMGPQAY
jgi:amino acid transporter